MYKIISDENNKIIAIRANKVVCYLKMALNQEAIMVKAVQSNISFI